MGKQIQQYMKFVEAYKIKVKVKAEWKWFLFTETEGSMTKQSSDSLFFFSFSPCDWQDEQYDHLDEADVTKVDKLTNDTMIWMNSAMNQQSKQSLSVDPSVKVKDIQAKTKVGDVFLKHRNTETNHLSWFHGLCLISSDLVFTRPEAFNQNSCVLWFTSVLDNLTLSFSSIWPS